MKNSKELFFKVLAAGMSKKEFAKKLKGSDGTSLLILHQLSNDTYIVNGNTFSKVEFESWKQMNEDSRGTFIVEVFDTGFPLANSEAQVIS